MAKIIGVSKFERLFREAAGLDVDKNDLARLNDFVRQKVYDLLLAAQATAKDNQRDVIQLHDLPLTLGFKESMRAFDGLDTALELQPILDQLVALPPLDLAYSYEMEAELPRLVGGLTVALARAFKILDPTVKNPQSGHWERAMAIFDLLFSRAGQDLDSGCAWQVQHCVSGRPGRSRFGNHESLLRRLQSLAQRLHLQTLPQQPEGGEKVSQ